MSGCISSYLQGWVVVYVCNCVYVCYTFSLWICALINKLKGWHSHTYPQSLCVPLLHTETYTQFEDNGCVACWPCYPLPSQHILSKTFAVQALYYMSDRERKRGDSEGNRDREREKLIAAEKCLLKGRKKWMTLPLFPPSLVFIRKWVIDQ